MDTRVKHGNANEDSRPYSGWLVGHFVEARRETAVEIKWTTHPAGDARAAWAGPATTTTISLLVSGGRFVIQFSDDPADEVVLTRQGDYAMWGPGIDHRWKTLEDSVVVTIRWPSVPG